MSMSILVLLAAISSQEHFVDPRTEIPVYLELSDEMFPAEWRGGQIKAKATPLATDEFARSTKMIKEALGYYPAKLLKAELKRVYISNTIEFYGLKYGGTNSLDTVYLTNQGVEKGYTATYFIGSFHHEFSSILLRNHPELFPEDKWKAANPTGFKYGDGGTEALRKGESSTAFSQELAKSGFLTQYSQASVEEDFNMTVQGLFSGDKEFWTIVDNSPKFKQKVDIVVSFYESLSPTFAMKYFRELKKVSASTK